MNNLSVTEGKSGSNTDEVPGPDFPVNSYYLLLRDVKSLMIEVYLNLFAYKVQLYSDILYTRNIWYIWRFVGALVPLAWPKTGWLVLPTST